MQSSSRSAHVADAAALTFGSKWRQHCATRMRMYRSRLRHSLVQEECIYSFDSPDCVSGLYVRIVPVPAPAIRAKAVHRSPGVGMRRTKRMTLQFTMSLWLKVPACHVTSTTRHPEQVRQPLELACLWPRRSFEERRRRVFAHQARPVRAAHAGPVAPTSSLS
jgi:hypothetical protein